jgi:uncharacterized protein (DUF2336 family)
VSDLQPTLARDSEPSVRWAMAQREDLLPELVALLRSDPDGDVRIALNRAQAPLTKTY